MHLTWDSKSTEAFKGNKGERKGVEGHWYKLDSFGENLLQANFLNCMPLVSFSHPSDNSLGNCEQVGYQFCRLLRNLEAEYPKGICRSFFCKSEEAADLL